MKTTTKINYYPFGMLMPGRSQYTNEYRYGFNGKENIDEMYGATGTFQDYGFRMYDPRTCRFISVDPITKQYPELTPYQFASNTPIMAIDLDGLEACATQGVVSLTGAKLMVAHANTLPSTDVKGTYEKKVDVDKVRKIAYKTILESNPVIGLWMDLERNFQKAINSGPEKTDQYAPEETLNNYENEPNALSPSNPPQIGKSIGESTPVTKSFSKAEKQVVGRLKGERTVNNTNSNSLGNNTTGGSFKFINKGEVNPTPWTTNYGPGDSLEKRNYIESDKTKQIIE